ncbi:UNVERIFIED_CONTAM: hypothetical protein K2H54_002882 [Gekko kuhli]
MRDRNLKFRGIPESSEAYCAGPKTKRNDTTPRDIVASFPDTRTRDAILKKAREGGGFTYLTHNIQVPLGSRGKNTETLQLRKNLSPITTKHTECKFRFRWTSPCELMVIHQGTRFFAHNYDSGLTLLNSLDIKHDLPHRSPYGDSASRPSDPAHCWI